MIRNFVSIKTVSRLVPVIFAAIVVFLLWLNFDMSRNVNIKRIQREGVLRIGYALEAPYVYLSDRGKLAGLDYETGQAIASRLGLAQIEWVESEQDALLAGLEAGSYDLIAAGMFISPQAASVVDFSEPVYHVSQALLVRSGNPFKLHSYADVQNNELVKLAVLRGGAEDQMFQQLGIPPNRIIGVPDARTGISAVENGIVDCLALSLPTLQLLQKRRALGRTEIANPFEQTPQPDGTLSGFAAAAFRKTDGALRAAWNKQAAEFVGSDDHIFILRKYGFGVEDLPGDLTTRKILSTNNR